jgi:hypothetical protein
MRLNIGTIFSSHITPHITHQFFIYFAIMNSKIMIKNLIYFLGMNAKVYYILLKEIIRPMSELNACT